MQDRTQIKEFIIKMYNAPVASTSCPDIGECLNRIKSFCRKALANEEIGSMTGAKWILDNYYVIERDAKGLIHQKGKKLPAHSRLYSYIESLFFFTEYELNDEVASCFFEVFSRNDFLSDEEIANVQPIMKAVIIKRITTLCREFSFGAGLNMALVEKVCRDESAARNLIVSLRKSSIIDFTALVVGYSPLERMLRLDPAGIYSHMDKPSQELYHKKLEILSKKKHKSKVELLEEMIEKAKNSNDERKKHIGYYLIEKPNGNNYVSLLITLSFIIWGISLWFCRDLGWYLILCALFLSLPSIECAKILADRIVSKFTSAQIIPKLKFDAPIGIPDESKTLTVITSLLFGGDEDNGLFERLERFYLANRDKNILFGILGDLKESKYEIDKNDSEIVKNTTEKINKLNEKYGNVFYMFIRGRVFCKTQNKYMGYERKRGAVIELTRLIRGNSNHTINHICGNVANLENIKYVLTLDADTNVGLSQINKLVGAMSHPLNKPEIIQKNGRYIVKSGYGIMQPLMSYALSPAGKTPFCVLMSGAGGSEVYSSAAFDIYQGLFGSGIFCGKGIFDVDAFSLVIDGAFPDEKVLSHDILEGCLLRCGLLTDVTFSDSLPHNPMSYFKRGHRWSRGDVQAMAYAGSKVKNTRGETTKNPISVLSKFKLWDNIRRLFVPIFSVLAIFEALILKSGYLSFFAVLYIFMPFFCGIVTLVFTGRFQPIYRKFFANVITGIWSGFLNVLYNLMMLFHQAYINADAMIRTLYRMNFSKKNLLEWATASEVDKVKKSGTLLYILYMKLSIIAGIVLIAFSGGGLLRLLGIFFVLSPFISSLISKPFVKKSGVSLENKNIITGYCRDMWKFFSDKVNAEENHLPPDNVQFVPVFSTASRCSPTNIGLYLLSAIAARDFEFIRTDELFTRVKNTLDTIKKLEKWHGHLYNWYDNHTLETIGTKYVSTVDSGNFVTALVALSHGLEEYSHEDKRILGLIEIINNIIDTTDFRMLYNSARDLFYLGYNAEVNSCGEGCYDLFMSEARTTSYFAVARGEVPKRHWASLGRILISRGFYLGAASWTGTAFEYFMPPLLLPIYQNSFSYEALQFAYIEQKKKTARCNHKEFWGISECGFYAFDAQMNYQYKALGVPFLSLKHEESDEIVISPYSSFLMLCRGKTAALENLERLKEIGMYSKYGFYEAVDFTQSRIDGDYARVESYMAHHVGMSIVACANAAMDNIFCRRFMSDAKMSCAVELLEEKIPVDAMVFNDIQNEDIPEKRLAPVEGIKSENINPILPKIALFSGHRSVLRVSDSAQVWFARHEERRIRCINNPPYDISSKKRSFLPLAIINGKSFSPAREHCDDICDVSFEYNRDSANFNISSNGRLVNVSYKLSVLTCALYVDLNVNFKEGDDIKYALFLEPVLEEYSDYLSHPAFTSLSLEAEYDSQNKIVLFRRRSRKPGDELCLAVGICDENIEFSFETRADILYKNTVNIGETAKSDKRLSNAVGACINPTLLIKADTKNRRRKSRNSDNLCFIVLSATTREKAVFAFLKARKNYKTQAESEALVRTNTKKALETSTDKMDRREYLLLERILRAASFVQNGVLSQMVSYENYSKEDLWQYSISGDLPIIAMKLTTPESLKGAGSLIMLHRLCAIKGLKYELVFLFEDADAYTRPMYGGIRSLLARYKSEYLLNQKGGVFLISDISNENLIKCSSSLWFEDEVFESESNHSVAVIPHINTTPVSCANLDYKPLLETYGGDFIDMGFVIDKINKKPPLAYSQILSNRVFGTLVTQNSLGYTWYSNSHEKRITRFENSPYDNFQSETIYLISDGEVYDLCRIASRVVYTPNMAKYYGRAGNIDFKIGVFVHEKLYVKFSHVVLSKSAKVYYAARPVMGSAAGSTKGIYYKKEKSMLSFGSAFGKEKGFLSMPYEFDCETYTSLFELFCMDNSLCDMAIIGCEKSEMLFALGAYSSEMSVEYIKKTLDSSNIKDLEKATWDMTRSIMGSMICRTVPGGDRVDTLNLMYNFWLPYQAIFGRFFARGGLYQSSGAYGFRDQLQDCRIFFRDNPKIARQHIIRSAAHQFEEGDVQHWWHNLRGKNGFHPGIRSRCSDDYLWLVLIATEYFEVTGDISIFEVKVNYLSDKPLAHGETERYSTPSISSLKESIYEHCKRALSLFDSRGLGTHGLPFIGSCDWNDGFSAVGEKRRGESVWLALFARIVLEKFAVVTKIKNDDPTPYYTLSDLLGKNVQENAFNGKWFIRGFYDDGSPLGDESCDECKIDLLPQAFSSICDSAIENLRPWAYRSDKKYIRTALDYAYKYLFDRENQILKLFTPPFDKSEKNPGYIKSYAPGLRENGGQYTHGAVWGILGFLRNGEDERAREIAYAICPAFKACEKNIFDRYKTEPYVLCGDVYSNPDHMGRGGWSWYTGSAGWYYDVIDEIIPY